MLTQQEKDILTQAKKTIDELRVKLMRQEAEGSVKTLLETINKSFIGKLGELVANMEILSGQMVNIAKSSAVTKDDILVAISKIKLEPQITVNSPDVNMPEIRIPEVKVTIPPIKVPKPEVTVNYTPPKIEIPPMKMGESKESAGFLKQLVAFFKNLGQDNPLHAILVDKDGQPYRAGGMAMVGGGGGGGRSDSAEGVGSGTTTVVTAGVRVQLPNVPCRRVRIQSHAGNGDLTNGGLVVIGDANVVAAVSGRCGSAYFATQGDWFNVKNLNQLWVDSMDDGAIIIYYWET